MSATTDAFLAAIDRTVDATESVVRRYRHAIAGGARRPRDDRHAALLEQTSLREGMRIAPLTVYRGVEVWVADETSAMQTKTLKSVDGCVTTARCLGEGHARILFESGGNTGTALTVYGQRAGLETFLVVPSENLALLDSGAFLAETTHLIAVDDPRRVKEVAAELAARHGLYRVPRAEWRYEASTFLGCFLLEHGLVHGRFDHLVQTISAAFAPIGIYRVLGAHAPALGGLPRFVGVQQEANCPMVRALRGEAGDAPPVETTSKLLARAMYDGRPQTYGTLDELRSLLAATGGDVTTVSHGEFRELLDGGCGGSDVLALLAAAGIEIALRGGEVIEKAGMVALCGTLKQIDAGAIAPGSRVLVCFTGGTGRPDGLAQPQTRIPAAAPAEAAALPAPGAPHG